MQNNTYQGYGYQPYINPVYQQRALNYQPPQMNQQQFQFQPQPQVRYEMPIQDVRFVTSEEAKAYIVMPNSKALLIDRDGMAYLKTADNMGQSQTDYFRFERVNADGTPIAIQKSAPEINFDDFIKKDDLEKLGFITVSQYNELLQKVEQIQKILDGAKNNAGTSKQPQSRM